jgi:hypothetical protein
MSFNKVIIWGFPLHTHTHSYIHGGWYKAFQHLGYETYWFHEGNHPTMESGFDYGNALFITEGYADNKIPIVSSSIYFVHVCIHPEKYLGKVARLIEIRYLVDNIRDCNYEYVLDKFKCIKISDATYYEKLHDNGGLRQHHNKPIPMEYECIYTCWATDLLPHEIDESRITHQRDKCIYWCCSYDKANNPELRKFLTAAASEGISVVFNNPWNNPLSYEKVQELTMKSFMSPDIRCSGDPNKIAIGETGTCHKQIGYIPCRVLKAISYGLLGITNSRQVWELLNKKVIYNNDEGQLFHDALKDVGNTELIKEQMKIVREHHTYVNRIKDLLQVLGI